MAEMAPRRAFVVLFVYKTSPISFPSTSQILMASYVVPPTMHGATGVEMSVVSNLFFAGN